MNETNDPRYWVEIAEEGLKTAQVTLRRKEPLLRSVGFSSQQCAEKYLKAILVSKKLKFPKTHDLRDLANLCEQAGIIVPVNGDVLDQLTIFAVQVRYPGFAFDVSDAQSALATAKLVRQFARKILGRVCKIQNSV